MRRLPAHVWLECIVAVLAALAACNDAYAGAWTLNAGAGQIIAGGTWTDGGQGFAADGSLVDVPRYTKFEGTALVEYGLTDWLTAVAIPDFLGVRTGSPGAASYDGLGQSAIGARARIWQTAASVFSFQALVMVPGAATPANAAQVGYTDVEADIRALAGHNFQLGAWPAFADVELAFRTRAGAPADELHLDLTLGVRPRPRWLVLLQSFSVVTAGPARPPFVTGAQYKIEASVVYDLTARWSLQLGALTTIAGRQMLREQGAVAAVWYRF